MSDILNEKDQKAALEVLAEKWNSLVGKAKEAINEHQPLNVGPTMGKAGEFIGTSAALGIQRVNDLRKGAGFFFKSIVKSFKETKTKTKEVEKLFEDVKKAVKSAPLNQDQLKSLKDAVEEHRLDIENK